MEAGVRLLLAEIRNASVRRTETVSARQRPVWTFRRGGFSADAEIMRKIFLEILEIPLQIFVSFSDCLFSKFKRAAEREGAGDAADASDFP
jgi:hypothetical protein